MIFLDCDVAHFPLARSESIKSYIIVVKSGAAHVCIICRLIKSLMVSGVCLVVESRRGSVQRQPCVSVSFCLLPAPFILPIPLHGTHATEEPAIGCNSSLSCRL